MASEDGNDMFAAGKGRRFVVEAALDIEYDGKRPAFALPMNVFVCMVLWPSIGSFSSTTSAPYSAMVLRPTIQPSADNFA